MHTVDELRKAFACWVHCLLCCGSPESQEKAHRAIPIMQQEIDKRTNPFSEN